MMKIIGRVYENDNKKSFCFSSKKYYSKGFVETYKYDNIEGNQKAICKITSVNAINKQLKSPDFIKYVEDDEVFSNDAIYIYTAVQISCINTEKNEIEYSYYPHFPGQRVFETDDKNVKLAYSLNDNGIKIGYLGNMVNNQMYLDLDKIFNPHLVVLGRTGSGKTYFISKLIPKIEDASVYVFSPTNEYNEIKDENKNFKLYEKKDMLLNYSIDSISYYYGLNMSEERILSAINLDSVKKNFSSEDIIKLIQEYYAKKSKSNTVPQQISFYEEQKEKSIKEDEIQFPQYALTLIEKLKKRKLRFVHNGKIELPTCAIFDFSDFALSDQECIINSYLFKIFNRQKNTNKDKRKKCYIFFEEAHNYIPSQKGTACKDIITRLAREGRKYGIFLCFITQRPRYFDQTAFSQTSNKIIFGMSHPDDIKYALDDSIYYDDEIASSIQTLRTGECIINGTAYKAPLLASIDMN